jgi:uncharacterized protein YlaI
VRQRPISRWLCTDCQRAKASTRGAVTHYGKEVHYDGAKDE